MRGPVVHEVVPGQQVGVLDGRAHAVPARLVAPAAPQPMRIVVLVIAPPTGES
ncbi:hypothetical protein [Umezawaea tangerina]|uniref:hypothetical protein n=1 Tax=Umezawaea tangerina TaxID=84725 RepID=UPI0014751810|nr:hypothetical protein [Umezawaea tangerina]